MPRVTFPTVFFVALIGALTSSAKAEGIDCTAAGPGFKGHSDLNVCARLGIDATVEFGQSFARHDLHIDTGRTEDDGASVDYGSFPRTVDRHKVSGNVLLKPSFSAVTATDFGPLWVHVRTSGSSVADELSTLSVQPLFLDDAWASLGVLTVGRRFSFFDYNPGFNYKPGYTSYRTTNVVALTSAVSDGVRASISLEDSLDRRREDGVWASYSKSRVPDLVGAVQLKREWGSAHASFAIHGITPDVSLTCLCDQEGRDIGFAGSAGFEYRQKFGETYGRVMMAGAVADGAMDYLGIPRFAPDYVSDAQGGIQRTKGVSAILSYEHVWRPNLKTSLSFSSFSTTSAADDFRWEARGYVGQFGVEYMPASDLVVGVELAHFFDAVKAGSTATTGPVQGASLDRLLVYTRRFF